jgi:hemerythrin
VSLQWQDKRYATGLPVIDAQHKEMFDHITDLLKASEVDERQAELLDMIEFLGGYVEQHFRYEEELMEAHDCSARDENKDDHLRFIEKLESIKTRVGQEGNTEPLRQDMMALVVQWLDTHISDVDGKLRGVA